MPPSLCWKRQLTGCWGADYQHQHLHLDETRWPSFSNARHTLPAACVPGQLPDLDKFTVLKSQTWRCAKNSPCTLQSIHAQHKRTINFQFKTDLQWWNFAHISSVSVLVTCAYREEEIEYWIVVVTVYYCVGRGCPIVQDTDQDPDHGPRG